MKSVGSRLHVLAKIRSQQDQKTAQSVIAQFGQEGGREIWSLILQDHGPPEGEAITREQTQMKKMLKAEKEEGEEKKRKSRSKSKTPTPETTTPQASASQQ